MKTRRSLMALLGALIVGFTVTGAAVPMVRFLWVAYRHAGF